MSGRGSKPGERRGGRRKGTPNKINAALKDMILKSLEEVGGVKYLVRQARRNPTAYMTLLGKVLPTTLTGPDGKELPSFNVNVQFGPQPAGQREAAEPERSAPGPAPLPSPAEPSQAPRSPWLN